VGARNAHGRIARVVIATRAPPRGFSGMQQAVGRPPARPTQNGLAVKEACRRLPFLLAASTEGCFRQYSNLSLVSPLGPLQSDARAPSSLTPQNTLNRPYPRSRHRCTFR